MRLATCLSSNTWSVQRINFVRFAVQERPRYVAVAELFRKLSEGMLMMRCVIGRPGYARVITAVSHVSVNPSGKGSDRKRKNV